MPRQISTLSTDYDRWAFFTTADPRGTVVQFAYLPVGSNPPGLTDWFSGVWESAQLSTGEWVAAALVGSANGGHVLTIGTYDVWIKVTSTPEVPVWQPGTLTVVP